MNPRYVSIGAYASLLVFGMSMTVIGPAVDSIALTFSVPPGDLGLLITALSLGFIAAVFLAGTVADRLSLKPIFLVGQAAVTSGLAGFALCPSLEAGMALFLLMGFGGGLVQISANTLISSIHSETRTSSLTVLHLFYGTGALAGPLVSGALISRGHGWQAVYFTLAILSLAVAAVAIPLRFPPRGGGVSGAASFLRLLKNAYILLVCLAAVLYVGIEMGITSWAVLYLEKNLSMEKMTASSVLSYFWFFMTFGRLFCVRLARHVRPGALLLALSAGAALAFALFFAAGSGTVAGVALSLVGLFFSGIFPILMSLGGNAFPDRIGGITGILLTSLGVGLAVFPWAAGEIGTRWSLSTGMLFLACIHVALVAVSWFISRREPARAASL